MRVFIIAGEPSGDRLGAALMAGLQAERPEVAFAGLGGPEMGAAGLRTLFPIDELALMGLIEVLPRAFQLRRRIAQTVDALVAARPDVVITIDSPGFCLRVLARVRQLMPGLPHVHYVAPQVWAWKPGRAAKMAPLVDHVLALLPFEPPYMHAAGMSCDFVGHPVVAQPVATPAEVAALRADAGIEGPLALVLPGSRQGEVARLGPRFGAVVGRLIAARPDVRIVVPTLPARAEQVRALVADWPGTPLVLDGHAPRRNLAAFAAADVALAASGTVSLDLAQNAVPMVIAYDFNPISRILARRLALVDTVTLVNLVTQTRTIPEFLLDRCQPELIAPALIDLLGNAHARAQQRAAMTEAMRALGQGGDAPGTRAARSVLAFLARA
jgi:lipid-A-disaccharide synthase